MRAGFEAEKPYKQIRDLETSLWLPGGEKTGTLETGRPGRAVISNQGEPLNFEGGVCGLKRHSLIIVTHL